MHSVIFYVSCFHHNTFVSYSTEKLYELGMGQFHKHRSALAIQGNCCDPIYPTFLQFYIGYSITSQYAIGLIKMHN